MGLVELVPPSLLAATTKVDPRMLVGGWRLGPCRFSGCWGLEVEASIPAHLRTRASLRSSPFGAGWLDRINRIKQNSVPGMPEWDSWNSSLQVAWGTVRKPPRFNVQAPEKIQGSLSKTYRANITRWLQASRGSLRTAGPTCFRESHRVGWSLGAWSFSGCWWLEFEASSLCVEVPI
jgi:hypothetical protein